MMSYRQWLVLLAIYIVFMLVGAVGFLYLEIDNELADIAEINALKRKVLDLVANLENDTRESVVELVEEMGSNCKEDFLHIDDTPHITWSYWNSFFFTFTVITTIGFGHMSPATSWGKIFCIVYATIGVPLNGILIASLADIFSSKVINSRVRARAKRYESWIGIAADAALFLLPGFIVFLVIPAAVLVAAEEDWDYLDSFYFAFITLTTIGFGDLVAGQQDKDYAVMWLYKIIMFVWIIFGLGYLIMGITLIQDALKSKKIHNIERRLARVLKKQASRVNANFHRDLRRMRTVVNALSVMNSDQVYPENEKGSICPIKRVTSQPILNHDTNYLPRSDDRIFLSHHHTPEQQRIKLQKDYRSISEAAISVMDKSDTTSQTNPMGNVNIFLDMVESLLKEHEERAAQTAEDDARKIIEETVDFDLSCDSGSDEEPSTPHQAESSSKDLEAGYLNKGYVDDNNQAVFSKIEDLPRVAVKCDKESKEVNDRIQKKLSTLLGIPDLRKTSLIHLPVPTSERVQTASELLGLVENIVCKPWSDNHNPVQIHFSPTNTVQSEPVQGKQHRRVSSSVPGRYRAAPENGRPHLLDVFQIATTETDLNRKTQQDSPNIIQLDSPSCNQDTITSTSSSESRRRWSFGYDPCMHPGLEPRNSNDTGNEVLINESKHQRHNALQLFSKWLQRDLHRENSDSSEEDKTQEYSHL